MASIPALADQNIAGGSGDTLSFPPLPAGVLGDGTLQKNFYGLKLRLDWLKLSKLIPLKTLKSQQTEESLHFPSPLLHKLLPKQAVVEVLIRISQFHYGEVCTHASWKTARTQESFDHRGLEYPPYRRTMFQVQFYKIQLQHISNAVLSLFNSIRVHSSYVYLLKNQHKFCNISENTFFTEHFWAAASINKYS